MANIPLDALMVPPLVSGAPIELAPAPPVLISVPELLMAGEPPKLEMLPSVVILNVPPLLMMAVPERLKLVARLNVPLVLRFRLLSEGKKFESTLTVESTPNVRLPAPVMKVPDQVTFFEAVIEPAPSSIPPESSSALLKMPWLVMVSDPPESVNG